MDAEKKEASWISLLLSAVAMLWLGLLLGFLCFLSIAPKAYTSLSDRDKALEAKSTAYLTAADGYYFTGAVIRGSAWTTKREQLVKGTPGQIEISVGELNAWLDANLKPAGGVSEEGGSGVLLRPQTPNLAIVEDGRLHLSLPMQFDGFGLNSDFVMHAVGRFVEDGVDSPDFKIQRFSINAAPLPALLGQRIFDSLLEAFQQSPELQTIEEAWGRVASAELVNGSLRLEVR